MQRSKIFRGTATIRDVAKASGFSLTTVSFVLNSAPLARYIPDQTRNRIIKTATDLGYHANVFARSLRRSSSDTVGLMVFDITDPYCTPIVSAIQNALYATSYVPVLVDAQNERARFERYLEMLLGSLIEGLLVVANWLFVDIDLLADLARTLPIVVIGRDVAGTNVSSITVDNRSGGSAALEHLYLLGHRKIVFLRGPKTVADSAMRWRGIWDSACSRHFDINEDLVVDLPDSKIPLIAFNTAYHAMRDILSNADAFTAVLAFDDVSALGAMRALAEAGIRVPYECSVIGFDDIQLAHLCTPGLTTIRQPLEQMGTIATKLLLHAIAERNSAQTQRLHQMVVPELVVRESTAAPPQ